MKLALIQMNVCDNTEENIKHAHDLALQASENKADLIVLPEIFTCAYQSANFPAKAFDTNSDYYKLIQNIAQDTGKFLVAGSVPEKADGNVYNTSFVFNPEGKQIARHRKVHLFDIDVEGGQKFKESDTLTAGNEYTIFDTPFAKIGVIICYDIRFPEFSRILVDKGAELIIVPAAFNMTTGPAHWELSFRARALDNQVFYAGCAPARNIDSSYVSYANSIVTNPWGEVIAKANINEKILYADINFDFVEKIRNQLPLLKHRRNDLYVKFN